MEKALSFYLRIVMSICAENKNNKIQQYLQERVDSFVFQWNRPLGTLSSIDFKFDHEFKIILIVFVQSVNWIIIFK